MAFTLQQAQRMLLQARERGRLPHALLITGAEEAGTRRLALSLAEALNGARAESLETLRHPMCRIIRPGSKIRSIPVESVRAVEPFLSLRAMEGETKLVIMVEAERMKDEAANAFLKTLEEPPPQTLIILITEQPDHLLPTILSRCVRVPLHTPGAGLHLSEAQRAFLPAVQQALPDIGSDVTALALRADLTAVLAQRREQITDRLTEAVKAEAKAVAEGTDIKDWESRQKDATAAQIETEYLREREEVLELLSLCIGQAVLLASHAPDVKPLVPQVAELAKRPLPELLRRMRAVDALRSDLNFNVNEALALEARLIDIIGNISL